MFYINLIGLNSLIAILGDSYGKVMCNADMYDIIMRLGLLLDFHQIFIFKRNDVEMKYIHVITYQNDSGG